VGWLEPWRTWAARWERFQEAYVPCREEQIETILGYAGASRAHGPLKLLDLASGPGSIARRALRLLPAAEIVNLDADAWLLDLGRCTIVDDRISWVKADLCDPGWKEALPARRFHAVVTMTAMHWFDESEVRGIYRNVASLVAPGGLFLCADLVPPGRGGSAASRRALELVFRWQAEQTAREDREDWVSFWRGARAEPAFRHQMAVRDREVGLRRPRRFLPFESHAETLTAAGFCAVEEVWRRDAAAVVAATR